MRTILFAMMLATGFMACEGGATKNAQLMADSSGYTRIQWLDSIVRFDTIRMGGQAQVSFRFRNTGDKPLYLTEVKAGCGCTVPNYTKDAIAPGGEGVVTGAFDSNKAHPGEVRKSIFVTANTLNGTKHTLIFTGLIRE
jgi:hypothetical protein